MKSTFRPCGRVAASLNIRRFSCMALLCFFAATAVAAKIDPVELPLVLESEFRRIGADRQKLLGSSERPGIHELLRSSRLSQNCAYELIVLFGYLEKYDATETNYFGEARSAKKPISKDYEPVGLHLYSERDMLRSIGIGDRALAAGVISSQGSLLLRTSHETIKFESTEKEGPEISESSASYSDENISVRLGRKGGTIRTSGKHKKVPLHWMAESLANFSEKNVLVSARVEKRWCPEFSFSGSSRANIEQLEELLKIEGVEVKLIGRDAYALVEAPGKEHPFPYASRPRAMQYETEREAWLTKYPGYDAQGLIYQPTKQSPIAYPERDVRVRHAAAALAKLTGKEVFVQPLVEKREFKVRKEAGQLETPALEIELLTRQLDKANVQIVKLNPQSLALVAK